MSGTWLPTWGYWLLFAFGVVGWIVVPLCSILEDRADRKDRDEWGKQPGATR